MMNEEIKALIEREAIKEARYDPNDPLYADNWINKELHVGAYDGFKLGANFALSLFRWRKVEEELPEDQEIVLVKTDKGCFATAYLHGENSGFIVYGDDAYCEFGKITHWMPIPQ